MVPNLIRGMGQSFPRVGEDRHCSKRRKRDDPVIVSSTTPVGPEIGDGL